jgi:hypothetical protein
VLTGTGKQDGGIVFVFIVATHGKEFAAFASSMEDGIRYVAQRLHDVGAIEE